MAVLGVQIVFSMIMASFLSKISAHFSFGRWLLCGGSLARFVPPSDDDLRKLAGTVGSGGSSRGKNGKRNDRRTAATDDPLTISKSADIQLELVPVRPTDLLPLQFYTEYQWLMDFAVCGILIYSATEAYYAFARPPSSELNLSMFWCILIMAFSVKTLISVTAIYFRTDDAGERILCIVFGLFFLVVAMAILVIPETMLDFGLEKAYAEFAKGAMGFLSTQGLESSGPVSLLSIRIGIALTSAVLGALLTFPGLRLARMHTDGMRYAQEQPFRRVMMLINMILPLVAALAWVRPLARDPLARCGIVDDAFESIRLSLIILTCVVRLSLVRPHLQAHLNMAYDRVLALHREPGRISTIELKKLVVRVYYYLCVIALQYLAPVVLLVFAAFLLKTLGDISVLRAVRLAQDSPTVVVPPPPASMPFVSDAGGKDAAESANESSSMETTFGDIFTSAVQFSRALTSMRQVFTPACFHCLISFLCWWICSAWFATSSFGLIYYSYFDV